MGEPDSGDVPKLWWLDTDEADEDEDDGISSSLFWLFMCELGEDAEHGMEFWRFWLRSMRAFFSG